MVRKLGLTQATAHAILTTLCDRGWASRDPVDKTFSLGPALAAVAARVDTARPLAHTARAAALQLAAEFGYAASVVERFGDSLVITAFEDAGRAIRRRTRGPDPLRPAIRGCVRRLGHR